MSEFESIFDRETPEVIVRFRVEGKDIRFNACPQNSAVFTHADEFNYYDHIWFHGSQLRTPVIMWRDNSGDFAVGEQLIDSGWIPIYQRIPSEGDEASWQEWMDRTLAKELKQLERGEIPWE